MPITLAFVGYAPPETAAQASSYEDEAIALFAGHGGELVFRGRRQDGQHAALPWEVHVLTFPDHEALASYMADPQRLALVERYGDVFSSKQLLEVDVIE